MFGKSWTIVPLPESFSAILKAVAVFVLANAAEIPCRSGLDAFGWFAGATGTTGVAGAGRGAPNPDITIASKGNRTSSNVTWNGFFILPPRLNRGFAIQVQQIYHTTLNPTLIGRKKCLLFIRIFIQISLHNQLHRMTEYTKATALLQWNKAVARPTDYCQLAPAQPVNSTDPLPRAWLRMAAKSCAERDRRGGFN